MFGDKKLFSSFGYVLLFGLSFLFFIFMTFPYGLLKETVLSRVSEQTDINIRIAEFGPSLPLGFYATRVRVSPLDSASELEFERAKVSLSMFRLLMGEVAINLELRTANRGWMEVQGSWRIFSLIRGQVAVPRRILLEARDFDLANSTNFLLKYSANQANDLIRGTLAQMEVRGLLNGDLVLVMAADDPVQSSGEVNLEILEGVLDLNDPDLNIPAQNFSKALIRANLRGGRLILDDSSGLTTQELAISLNGSTSLRNPLELSVLDIDIGLQIQGTLRDNFGFLLSMMGGGSEDSASYKLTGTMERPSFNAL